MKSVVVELPNPTLATQSAGFLVFYRVENSDSDAITGDSESQFRMAFSTL